MGVMELIPITDPTKRVTDPEIVKLAGLKKWNLDFVEFSDYAKERPYGKLYTAYETGENVLVTSGLPMVRGTDGSKIVPGFEQVSNGKYWIKNNLFDGYVSDNGEIHLAAVNDQPDGVLAGDEGHWSPVLTVGTEKVSPKGVSLLETDPQNENLHYNVLEWDYGVCTRRIRIIEGRFQGSWIFGENPGADVRIEYNRSGKLHMRYGVASDRDGNAVEVVLPEKDVEYIPVSAWKGRSAPITVGDSATFYPESGTAVDGMVNCGAPGTDGYLWATLRAAYSGYNYANCPAWSLPAHGIYAAWNGQYGYFELLCRSFFHFDTSALGASATISGATLSLCSDNFKQDTLLLGDNFTPTVYESTAGATSLSISDFSKIGSTAYSGAIKYSDWTIEAYNTFTLNSSGVSSINKTGLSKFGVRDAYYDAGANEPNWGASCNTQVRCYFSGKGEGYKPKLIVTYTLLYKPAVLMNHYSCLRRR